MKESCFTAWAFFLGAPPFLDSMIPFRALRNLHSNHSFFRKIFFFSKPVFPQFIRFPFVCYRCKVPTKIYVSLPPLMKGFSHPLNANGSFEAPAFPQELSSMGTPLPPLYPSQTQYLSAISPGVLWKKYSFVLSFLAFRFSFPFLPSSAQRSPFFFFFFFFFFFRIYLFSPRCWCCFFFLFSFSAIPLKQAFSPSQKANT